tara:strand:+ start:6259 stop:6552 length:294 start_codon:yes stop_codon:yes gene_type:complete
MNYLKYSYIKEDFENDNKIQEEVDEIEDEIEDEIDQISNDSKIKKTNINNEKNSDQESNDDSDDNFFSNDSYWRTFFIVFSILFLLEIFIINFVFMR